MYLLKLAHSAKGVDDYYWANDSKLLMRVRRDDDRIRLVNRIVDSLASLSPLCDALTVPYVLCIVGVFGLLSLLLLHTTCIIIVRAPIGFSSLYDLGCNVLSFYVLYLFLSFCSFLYSLCLSPWLNGIQVREWKTIHTVGEEERGRARHERV